MSPDLQCKAEDLHYINRCFCTLIAMLCTRARLLYMASLRRGNILALLSSELSIFVLSQKLPVHQSRYVCFWMSYSLYETCTVKVMSADGWLVYLNPIGSTCNRCCDCKQMVRSKNNTLKGRREIPYRKQGKNPKSMNLSASFSLKVIIILNGCYTAVSFYKRRD